MLETNLIITMDLRNTQSLLYDYVLFATHANAASLKFTIPVEVVDHPPTNTHLP